MRQVILLGLLCVFGCAGTNSQPTAPEAIKVADRYKPVQEAKPDKKVYPREEFKTLVMGKTQDQVLELIGAPASMSENRDPNGGQWFYHDITKDPTTNKIDPHIRLRFEKGKVASIVVL